MSTPVSATSAHRGQAMVLYAAALFLLTVLVCLSLALATRMKHKMELQTLADASAYSNAVQTARTMNFISLTNRAAISQWVALAGAQGLISWSSHYVAVSNRTIWNLVEVREQFKKQRRSECRRLLGASRCGPTDHCADSVLAYLGKVYLDYRDWFYDSRYNPNWEAKDKAAAQHVKDLQQGIFALGALQTDEVKLTLDQGLGQQQVVQQVLASSGVQGVLSPPAANEVTMREVDGEQYCAKEGAICRRNSGNRHMVTAAQGTRGHPFLTSRKGTDQIYVAELRRRFGEAGRRVDANIDSYLTFDFWISNHKGSSYFANLSASPSHSAQLPSDGSVWGDDHGEPGVQVAPGPVSAALPRLLGCGPHSYTATGGESTWSRTKSDDLSESGDAHKWFPSLGNRDWAESDATEVHTLAMCEVCPSVWMWFSDFNRRSLQNPGNHQYNSTPDDAFGQPKNLVVLTRDTAQLDAQAPWNLFFNFRLQRGAQVDFRAKQGEQMAALATGMAYYHRHGHWREPPNFLNPFWRATLVAADIDATGRDDILTTLSNAQVDTAPYQALLNEGFQGFH